MKQSSSILLVLLATLAIIISILVGVYSFSQTRRISTLERQVTELENSLQVKARPATQGQP